MTEMLWLNGEFVAAAEASVSVYDRGFLFADSVYEVVPVFSGRFFLLEPHLDRLEYSLQALNMSLPYSKAELAEVFQAVVAKNGGGDLAVYCQITRGVGTKRDHVYSKQKHRPTVLVMAQPIERPNYTSTYSAIVQPDIRWHRADIKSTSLLPNIMLKQQAEDAGAAEAILHRDGLVTEGAATNVFVVQAGKVMTPPKSHWLLGGITREVVIQYLHEMGTEIHETDITLETLKLADEVWMTSSAKGALPIGQLKFSPSEVIRVGNESLGPVWRQLNDYFWSKIPV